MFIYLLFYSTNVYWSVTMHEITWSALGYKTSNIADTFTMTTATSRSLTKGILCIKHCSQHFAEICSSQQPYEVGAITILIFTFEETQAWRD